MRVSDQGRQHVPPYEFWGAIVFVILLLGGMGVVFMNTGHVPSEPRWVWGVSLAGFWVAAFFRFRRYGKAAYPWRQWPLPVGGTLMAMSHIAPAFARAAPWAEVVGITMVGVGFMSIFFDFRKLRSGEVEPRDGAVRDE